MMGMNEISFASTEGEGARIGRPAEHASPRHFSLVAAPVGA